MVQRILVPLDGSDSARQALEHASLLQRMSGAALRLLRVKEPPSADEHLGAMVGVPPVEMLENPGDDDSEERHWLASIWHEVGNRDGEADWHVASGDPAPAIVEQAREFDADLIVMGSRGQGQFQNLIFGSVSQQVSETAPCPVITYHVPETASA
ncbi:universal stress protein [Salinicola avicenniae]|uniref:universal stress protein n=1 Tax=Salinicola avicenniae TaxID=2916836 RepID=UPI0020742941|nr:MULTISPECIES: universal stress protein [unclassified Salinicola]